MPESGILFPASCILNPASCTRQNVPSIVPSGYMCDFQERFILVASECESDFGLKADTIKRNRHMAIKWTKDLSTGVGVVDQQHKELFKQINQLHGAMVQGRGRDEIGNMFDFLGKYVVEHFTAEEREMELMCCPVLEENKQAHREFLEKFDDLRESFDEAGPHVTLVLETFNTLSQWLLAHITKIDTQMKDCVVKS